MTTENNRNVRFDNSALVPKKEADTKKESTTPQNGKSKNLRSNLMREQQRGRDPLFYYEVDAVLGVGSMGSVIRVRKRADTVGGSARKSMQQKAKQQKFEKDCVSIPIFGFLFKHCIRNNNNKRNSITTSASGIEDSIRNSMNSITGSNGNVSVVSTDSSYGGGGSSSDIVQDIQNGRTSSTSPGSSKHLYAMKSIHLDRISDKQFIVELLNEIDILKNLDHPHVVRPIETFELKNQIFIVMELCSGGDLYTRDPYTESEAARIVSCILSAISYMHSKNIAHRDLKYENILFVNKSPQAVVKLIDFGLSKFYSADENENLSEGVGTIYTMAPEVITGNYTKQADLWSVGVITYMLLSSQMPFYGRKRKHIIELILSNSYNFHGRRWKTISNQAKEFVQDLLIADPDDRLTADEAYSSAWLHKRSNATVRMPYLNEEVNVHKSILQYAKYSKLKKLALMIIAHKATNDDIGILRKVFEKYDKDKSGDLSYNDFKSAFVNSSAYTNKGGEEELKTLFDELDLDGTGNIRYTEFLAATIESQTSIEEDMVAEAFDRIDSDDSGYITVQNLVDLLGADFPKDQIENIIHDASPNDKKISYPEFLALWTEENARAFNRMDSSDSYAENGETSDEASDRLKRSLFLESKQNHLENLQEINEMTPADAEKLQTVAFVPREATI